MDPLTPFVCLLLVFMVIISILPVPFRYRRKLDKNVNLFNTRFWRQVSTRRPVATFTMADMALSSSDIKVTQVCVGLTTVWALDDANNLHLWNKDLFAEYNYRYDLLTRDSAGKQKEVFGGGEEAEEEEEAYDVDSNTVVHLAVGCDDSVFGVSQDGKVFFVAALSSVSGQYQPSRRFQEEEGDKFVRFWDIEGTPQAPIKQLAVVTRDQLWVVDENVKRYCFIHSFISECLTFYVY